MFLTKEWKFVFFLLSILLFFKPIFSSIIYDGKTFVKNSNNYFYFDSLDLLNKKYNLINKILIENKKVNYIESNCYISNQNPGDLGGNLFLAEDSKTKIFSKWVFKANKEGIVTITCKATAELSGGETLEASESREFIVGDPNEICNPNDLLFSDPNLNIDYLELIRQSYYLHQTKKKPLLFSFTFQINTENLKGKLEDVVINCSDYTNNYPLEVIGGDISYSTNIIQRDFDVYLANLFNKYKERETLICKLKAYCDFYGNKDLGKEIEKTFTFQLNINPLNDSFFYVINYSLLNFSNKAGYLYNLTKYYQKIGVIQSLEAMISPYIVGLPGLFVDLVLNPFFLWVGKIFGKLTGTCVGFCDDINNYLTCLSCDSTVLSDPDIITTRKFYAAISSIFLNINTYTSWIPLFFTTLSTIQAMDVYYLSSCDINAKWIYDYSGYGILFAILNMAKHPPTLSVNVNEELEKAQKASEKLSTSFEKIKNETRLNLEENIITAKRESKIFTNLRVLEDKANVVMNILTYPFDRLIYWLGSLFGINDLLMNPCEKSPTKNSNPGTVASDIVMEFIQIAGGTGKGDFFMIGQTPQADLLALIYSLISSFKNSDIGCKIKNTLYPLSFIGQKEKAYGVRLSMDIDNNGKVNINSDFSLKRREYDVCPLTVAQSLSTYLVLLSKNSECLIKSINWNVLKNLFPESNGDLIKILNENLSSLIMHYGELSVVDLKDYNNLIDYQSIINLAGCSNIKKYILCLENELVKECKSNRWKESGLITLQYLTDIFSKYLSNLLVNLIIESIKKLSGFDVCTSSTFKLIKTAVNLGIFTAQFVEQTKALEETENCLNSIGNINLSDIQNTDDFEKLTINNDECSKVQDSGKVSDVFECISHPKKCSIVGWLNLISLLVDPNLLNNEVANKIREKIRKKINDLIKIDTSKCSIEETSSINIKGLNELFYGDQIFLNGNSVSVSDIVSDLGEYGANTGLTLLFVNFSKKPDGVIYFKKLGKYCLNPSERDLKDCNKIKVYYPDIDPNTYYCIRNSKSNYITLGFYNSYPNCEIYLVKQGIDANFEKILLYSSNNCKGEQKVELSKKIYDYFGKCDHPKKEAYEGVGFNILVKGYDSSSYEEAIWNLDIDELCSGLPSYYVFKGSGC